LKTVIFKVKTIASLTEKSLKNSIKNKINTYFTSKNIQNLKQTKNILKGVSNA